MQLQLGEGGGIRHGFIKNFLLEKVRVTQQGPDERSYHVFYQLLQGASASLKSSLQLLKPDEYAYLRTGSCYTCPGNDDAAEFHVVERTFDIMQFSKEEINTIWSLLSGVLLLGNVEIQSQEAAGVPDAAHLSSETRSILSQCCKLLFLDPAETEREFLFNVKVIGNQSIESPVTLSAAQVNRDSLAKAVYEKLFDWIVLRLNQTIQPPGGFKKFIGMLDIFGFEVFQHNSLEQLLINITNEQLQGAFIQIVFARETELYRAEGIGEAKIEWTDNKVVVDALCGKRDSVLALLEDKSLAPGGTDESIVQGLSKCLAMSDAWKPGRKNPRVNFIICHSIADIQYDATGFIFKNKDLLKPELCAILKASKSQVVKDMFKDVVSEKGKLGKGQLIASQFMRSLNALLELIRSTESHFVRCLKPNESKQPKDWNNAKVLGQLFSLSILEALQLKNFTFSYRRPYDAFLKQFEQIDYAVACGSSEEREKVKMLMARTGIPQDQWALGKTMVFVKPAAIRELTQRMRELMRAWEPVVKVVEAVYKFNKRMQLVNREVPWAIRIQAHVRKAKAMGRKP